jgi:hypothetical protein
MATTGGPVGLVCSVNKDDMERNGSGTTSHIKQ